MKRWIGILICFISLQVHAQQLGQYSQYLFNHFLQNPAFAGSQSCLKANMGYRMQWVGFDGAPRQGYLSMHMPINSKHRHIRSKQGAGLIMENDLSGVIGKTRVYLAYAYHMALNQTWFLSAGLQAGVQQFRTDVQNIALINPADPAITYDKTFFVWPDFGAGFMLFSDKQFFSFSIPQISSNPLSKFSTGSKHVPHILFTTSREIKQPKKQLVLIPSINLRFAPFSNPSIDFSLFVEPVKQVRLGAGYRNGDALIGSFEVKLNNYFTLGYSYDYTLSKVRHASSNTHEVGLSMSACKWRPDTISMCPTFIH